ncbi:MAG: [protein-PII] uridylyltransferase [Gammaproteobacteria bacterium]|nr:[protein-PII] uridylyltransferase [Gammaproteobacteria bacterium]
MTQVAQLLETLDRHLDDGTPTIKAYKETLSESRQWMREAFESGAPVEELVQHRAGLVDAILSHSWEGFFPEKADDITLVAVGGYGRGELHPASDIDILILLKQDDDKYRQALEGFITFMWDIGLELGHSIRSLADCVREAEADITVATNLMESRLIYGPDALFQQLREQTGPDTIWSSKAFFEAKLQEQRNRHHKYHDTAYNLEPNVKEGPGGLRDIQMIGWVAKRHFDADTLRELVDHDFLTESDYQDLWEGQVFLWRVRFALHLITGRHEDRLLFDHQRTIARQFGYQDEGHSMAVELFMKQYYRTIMELNRLNEMLLQLFQEEILLAEDTSPPFPINERFQIRKGFLEVSENDTFEQHPTALLELFLLMEQRPDLLGVRANTIRLVRENVHLIDEEYRQLPEARRLFLEILSQPKGVTHEIRRMNRYGVLAAYLPVFGKIVGLMQHDLFHVYTVDEHTLTVLRNVRRLTITEYAHEFPLASNIIGSLDRPMLLYIAALFHDIAKGRGGDHSELGAKDAELFCREHGLNDTDTELVVWLVKNHLVMSRTSQRKDISDPDVINEFAALVGDQRHLDTLFILTMADIRATSPTVWNSWKHALLEDLYRSTSALLERGLQNPLQENELLQEVKQEAMESLRHQQIGQEGIEWLWQRLPDEYFLHYSVNEVVWHALSILTADADEIPLVRVRQQTTRGGTEVFIYAPVQPRLFAQTTATIERMGLTVADARLLSSTDGFSFNTFMVLEENGRPISEPMRVDELLLTLEDILSQPDRLPEIHDRSLPRQLKHFPITTRVEFKPDEYEDRTAFEVHTMDRPGLLARIARLLLEHHVFIRNARITTLGERAEDVFIVTDEKGGPLDTPQQEALKEAIILALDEA